MSKLIQKVKWNLDGSHTEMYMYGEANFEANKAMQEPLEKLYKYENNIDMQVRDNNIHYPKCPYCGKSDGNDDVVLDEKMIHKDDQECVFLIEKECDICGRRYMIKQVYKLDHWNYYKE